MFFAVRVLPGVAVEFVSKGMLAQLVGVPAGRSDGDVEDLLARVHPDSAGDLAALLAMRPGENAGLDLTWRHSDGRTISGRCWARGVARPDGSVIVEGVVQDVTEPVRVDSELRRSEERHRLLAENAWDVIWSMALDGSITYVSPAVEKVRGITPAEAMVQPLDQVNPPESAAKVEDYLVRLFAAIEHGSEPPVFRGEPEYYRKDGSIMTGELQVIPHVDADGTVVEILGVTRDISGRKLLEVAEARYRRLMDSSVVATCLVDLHGRLLLVNQAMCDMVGYDAAALTSMTLQQLIATDHLAAGRQAFGDLIGGRRDSYRSTAQLVRADGHLIWGDGSLSCIRGQSGEVEHLVVQIVDISDEVEARHRLAARESQNQALATRLRSELDSAAQYVASILPGDLDGPVQVSSRYLPSQEVGGDCLNYAWIDSDHLIVYLIDVSGHGAGSALLAVSTHNMLRSGSLPTATLLAPEHVLTELNRHFRMENQGGNYFTIWYGVYQASTRVLRYAGAGHPPALVLSGGSATQLPGQSLPVGMFWETEFTASSYVVPPACQILLYSDGAFEMDLPEGLWGFEDFVALCTELAADPDWSLDELIARLRQLNDADAFDDDCSLVRLNID